MMFAQTSSSPDLVVLGAGPAGLSLAHEAAARGMRVHVVAPDPDASWPQSYGLWESELTGSAAEEVVAESLAHRFRCPQVWLRDGARRDLAQPYARLDTPRLQHALRRRAEAAGVTFTRGRARDLRFDARGATLRYEDGRSQRSPLVVDATGAGSHFVARTEPRAPAYQTAFGAWLEVEAHPYAPDEMALMDYRPVGEGAPTFLYALPEGPRRIFVEETCLASREPLPFTSLASRLETRLDLLGIRVTRKLAEERCLIPMGLALPRRDQRLVAFGAAASFVHPATGYQLARSLRLAAPVADALVTGLQESPAEAARRAYRAMWPSRDLRAWSLYQFGLDFLVARDAEATSAFLAAFFALPAERWLGFLTGRLSPASLCLAMLGVFGRAEAPLRIDLLRASGASSTALLRAALPMNPP
ncbi:MAG: lycopene cyclase family protein [Polyangiaceae bacterium]